ncbi:hypothetical protein BHE74_00015289 [Ensete ventricosum]|nr:hypothetical protein GW17_00016392 [Ensete ventricosum]RWW76611.1 hypothetical protein BHE74_00015289 [Ensete ventricosum]
MFVLGNTKVYNTKWYRPYLAVCTGPLVDWYVDHLLSGGIVDWGCDEALASSVTSHPRGEKKPRQLICVGRRNKATSNAVSPTVAMETATALQRDANGVVAAVGRRWWVVVMEGGWREDAEEWYQQRKM